VNPLGHGHTVIVRQPEIQQNNIRLGLTHFLEDLGAVGSSCDHLESGLAPMMAASPSRRTWLASTSTSEIGGALERSRQ